MQSWKESSSCKDVEDTGPREHSAVGYHRKPESISRIAVTTGNSWNKERWKDCSQILTPGLWLLFVGQRTRHRDGPSPPGHTRTASGWRAAETPGRREESPQVGRRKGEEELQTAGVSDSAVCTSRASGGQAFIVELSSCICGYRRVGEKWKLTEPQLPASQVSIISLNPPPLDWSTYCHHLKGLRLSKWIFKRKGKHDVVCSPSFLKTKLPLHVRQSRAVWNEKSKGRVLTNELRGEKQVANAKAPS